MGITLEQARDGIGRRVVYRSEAQRAGRDKRPAEDGTIVRVGDQYVHVAYVGGPQAATRPEDLDFANGIIDADEHRDRMIDAREAMRSLGGHR